jgi:rhodanese-related sulfurtransferase
MGNEMKTITAKEVETLLREGKPLNIVDVREADEARLENPRGYAYSA